MSKIMYANFNGIKNEQHTPDAIAKADLKNGQIVVVGVDEKGHHTAAVPASEDECKGQVGFVWNTIDQPELDNADDYVIKKGRPARVFRFKDGYPVYVSKDLVSGDASIGKYLVPDEVTYGGLKAAADNAGYVVSILVTEVIVSAQGVIYLGDVVIGEKA